MAKRKRFGNTPVGLARGDLERAQFAEQQSPNRANRLARVRAERRLLTEINRAKGRPKGRV